MVGVPVAILVGAGLSGAIADGNEESTTMDPSVAVAMLLLYLGIGVLAVAVRTAFENLGWNHTTIDGHRFQSRLRIGGMFSIYVTNLFAIGLTLGLAVPWARIRLARYRAACLSLLPAGPLMAEASLPGIEESATGAELSDAMDIDIGV